jgi:predicted RNA-binding Zn-ribbon protein involved in translation (DUF1610 family)
MNRLAVTLLSVGMLLAGSTAGARSPEPRERRPTSPMQQRMSMMHQRMMPMMLQMRQHRMGGANDWAATAEAVFVLEANRLHKFDAHLKHVTTVDLPQSEHATRPSPMGMGMMMDRMGRMLPRKLVVVDQAVFVSDGSRLMRFDHDLKLHEQADLPKDDTAEVEHRQHETGTKKMCPMCGQRMEMQPRHRKSEQNEPEREDSHDQEQQERPIYRL